MRPKFMALLVTVGVVAFCFAFFRTASPDIKGLERPEIKLSKFAGPDQNINRVNTAERSNESRFKKNQTDQQTRKERAKSRRNASRRNDLDNDLENRTTAGVRSKSGAEKKPKKISRQTTNRRKRSKTDYLRDRRGRRDRIESDRIERGLAAVNRDEVYEEEEYIDEPPPLPEPAVEIDPADEGVFQDADQIQD